MSTPFLESLRVTFPGFTSAHASSLYEEGLREAADFTHVSAADVKVAAQVNGGAMQIVLAGKIKAAAEAAATSNDGRAAKAAALRTHVGNLASRDPDVVSAAVDALSILGVTHLPVDLRPDGTVVLLAADVPRLLAVGRMASTGHAPSPVPTPTPTPATGGRVGVDWAAAGRKSWETRRRNAKSRT